MLYSHNLLPLFIFNDLYIGKSNDFDNGNSHTIDYTLLNNNKVVFNKVNWGYKKDNEKEIDTIKHEKLNISISNEGFIEYKPLELCNNSPLEAYLNIHDPIGFNIRKDPKGEIILNLNKQDKIFILTITEAKNGWLKLINIAGAEVGLIKIPGKIGWIHNSAIIEAGTRREITLIDTPENGIITGTIGVENQVVIIDKCANWVKIQYKEFTGWVDSKWLCGNPFTTCP